MTLKALICHRRYTICKCHSVIKYITSNFWTLTLNNYQNPVHTAQSFLRSGQFLSQSRNSPRFVESDGSLPPSHRARHLSLSWAISIQFMPSYPTSWRSISILSSHLRLDLPSSSFPQVCRPEPCMHLSPSHTCHMPRPSRFITRITAGEQFRSFTENSDQKC